MPSATPLTPSAVDFISLRGVRVHNLRNIDLDLPLQKLVVLTGVSGSGKSSLAFDTLYAEGQRRYIESFSPYARQFLNRLERPAADRIEHIPPAIAIRQQSHGASRRATVGTATEILDYLRLLFVRAGTIVCPTCQREVRQDSPGSAQLALSALPEGTRFLVCYAMESDALDPALTLQSLKEDGFTRVILQSAIRNLADLQAADWPAKTEGLVVVDRLIAGKTDDGRLTDSLELAFERGEGRCAVFIRGSVEPTSATGDRLSLDGESWSLLRFDTRLVCGGCQREFPQPEPRLLSFRSPLGACPECRGFGTVSAISFGKLVPDPNLTLREGAIACWTTPAYRHELDELLAVAADYRIPVDVPFSELSAEHLRLIREGIPARNFGGLQGFFAWLERHRYKLPVNVFLNRWRAWEICPACHGLRLQPDALAIRVEGLNLPELCQQTVAALEQFLAGLSERLPGHREPVLKTILPPILSRLNYLQEVGLSYLTLDRSLHSLSAGEAQRVALTAALGSNLVNALYVLDEPSAGLHPRDTDRLLAAVQRLQQAGNSVVVVEHEAAFIRQADQVIDVGPGAGQSGGEIVFQGTPGDLEQSATSVTGAYLAGRQSLQQISPSRRKPAGWLKLSGARTHNLQNVSVDFPLGVLCVVTGVSGSGKSSLVLDTLYPALCQAQAGIVTSADRSHYDSLSGAEAVGDVQLIDQAPIGKSPRSNPATYLKIFDDIRTLFAATSESKVRQFAAGQFSFNTASGGRCPNCEGAGTIAVDMQFLPDVSMTCPECQGTRFRRDTLDIKFRGLNVAEVLALTVQEAFAFFRGESRLQRRLKLLKDVGLEYLTLGQPASTLSGGESQRLKLAAALSRGGRSSTLFLLDEPTTGLHPADVTRLLDCFGMLLAGGHSLIVIEHHLDVMRAADCLIDLGPESGEQGGEVVATGTPEEVSQVSGSLTGKYLKAGMSPDRIANLSSPG